MAATTDTPSVRARLSNRVPSQGRTASSLPKMRQSHTSLAQPLSRARFLGSGHRRTAPGRQPPETFSPRCVRKALGHHTARLTAHLSPHQSRLPSNASRGQAADSRYLTSTILDHHSSIGCQDDHRPIIPVSPVPRFNIDANHRKSRT